MTRSHTLSVKLFHHLATTMPALVFGSVLALGSAHADEAVEICSGGALRTVASGQSVER